MEKLIIKVCASKDSFGAYSENCDVIFAAGDSLDACKKDVFNAIEALKASWKEEDIPAILKGEFEIEWKYDIQTILMHYTQYFSLAGLQRLTGINQRQLWNYANGFSKPRQAASDKITKALQGLGEELITLSL
ncbi:MAG: hypothetical protein J6K74_07805 [Marinifilaceae bacterium]|nr:hypothetical protein [Marinifilaceae bacterium]